MESDPSSKSLTRVVILVLLMPVLFWQCDRHEAMVGKYHAIGQGPHGGISATLELQANGKGLWSIATDNAPFRWDLRQNTIWLHTRSGGVIQGTVDDGIIRVAIPGTGMMTFTRHE